MFLRALRSRATASLGVNNTKTRSRNLVAREVDTVRCKTPRRPSWRRRQTMGIFQRITEDTTTRRKCPEAVIAAVGRDPTRAASNRLRGSCLQSGKLSGESRTQPDPVPHATPTTTRDIRSERRRWGRGGLAACSSIPPKALTPLVPRMSAGACARRERALPWAFVWRRFSRDLTLDDDGRSSPRAGAARSGRELCASGDRGTVPSWPPAGRRCLLPGVALLSALPTCRVPVFPCLLVVYSFHVERTARVPGPSGRPPRSSSGEASRRYPRSCPRTRPRPAPPRPASSREGAVFPPSGPAFRSERSDGLGRRHGATAPLSEGLPLQMPLPPEQSVPPGERLLGHTSALELRERVRRPGGGRDRESLPGRASVLCAPSSGAGPGSVRAPGSETRR